MEKSQSRVETHFRVETQSTSSPGSLASTARLRGHKDIDHLFLDVTSILDCLLLHNARYPVSYFILLSLFFLLSTKDNVAFILYAVAKLLIGGRSSHYDRLNVSSSNFLKWQFMLWGKASVKAL